MFACKSIHKHDMCSSARNYFGATRSSHTVEIAPIPRRLWSRRLHEVCLRPWDGCLWADNQPVRLLSDFNAYSATQCTMVYFDRFRSGISRNRTWTTQHCRSCYGLGPATKFHLPINRSHFVSRRSPRLSDGCQAVNNTTATTISYIVSWTQVGALLREQSRRT